MDYLLLHCSKTRVLWDFLFSLFGVSWILATTVKDFLLGWKGTFLPKEKQGVWNASPLCIFWTVWNTKNDIVFRDEVLSIQRLKSLFVHLFLSKTKVSIVEEPMTLVHFIDWVGA